MPIPPKPPWHSTPTAIELLPTAVPNCTSLITSPTDNCKNKPTENCKNTSKDNIENDRPDDDDDDDDVDCFPRQEKQPVLLQQDTSPTAPTATDTSPSLIEFPTDKPTDTTDSDNNNNIQRATQNNNNRPDDDNDNAAECSPWQDKQPMFPQDIPTPPQETNPDDDDNDNDSTIIHNNRCYANSDYDDNEADDTYYTLDDNSFDYATGIDDYATGNDGYDYDGGWYDDDNDNDYYYNNNNTPNIIFDMHGNQFTIVENDNMAPYDEKPYNPPSRTTTNKRHPRRMHHRQFY